MIIFLFSGVKNFEELTIANALVEPVISWEPWQRAGPDRRKESKYYEIRFRVEDRRSFSRGDDAGGGATGI